MANTKAALKRAKQSEIRRQRNSHYRSSVRSRVRAVREAVEAGDKAKAGEALSAAASTLHAVAGKGIIPTSTAGRKLSRLATAVEKMG